MHSVHNISHSHHELIDLALGDRQWRRHFQHHKVVAADSRQDSSVSKHPHDHDLTEHRWMDGPERLEWDFQHKQRWPYPSKDATICCEDALGGTSAVSQKTPAPTASTASAANSRDSHGASELMAHTRTRQFP